MYSEQKPSLGTYLRSLRDANGMTLREVEDKTGISNAFLSQIESGKVKRPSPVMLHKLAETYGVPYEALMDQAGYPVPEAQYNPRVANNVFNRLGEITHDEEQALLDYLSFLRSKKRERRRK
jgi:transcriptional regulator with XRE-family HTH domain